MSWNLSGTWGGARRDSLGHLLPLNLVPHHAPLHPRPPCPMPVVAAKPRILKGAESAVSGPLSTKGPAWELLSVRRPRAHTPLAAQCLDSGRWTPDGTRIGGHQPGLDLALSQARKLTVSPGLPCTPRVVPGLEPPGLQSGLSGWEARADGGDQ